jgi:hypothetical protein
LSNALHYHLVLERRRRADVTDAGFGRTQRRANPSAQRPMSGRPGGASLGSVTPFFDNGRSHGTAMQWGLSVRNYSPAGAPPVPAPMPAKDDSAFAVGVIMFARIRENQNGAQDGLSLCQPGRSER